ncbi:hypothetical protein [Thermomonospora umbrina]|uniref:hypothetical protein n=1 Tax=Thermomonospora umbrina TaxID=111806 RepID=UPI0011C0DEFB|nr:hypothetical protein [Thermomonospora umbrina]
MSDEQKLSEAMRSAMADVSPPADLVRAGLARGRRARRRARAAQTAGAALALSAVTFAGVNVLGGGPEQKSALSSRGTSSPEARRTGEQVSPAEMSRILQTMLPKGVRLIEVQGAPVPGVMMAKYDDGKGLAGVTMAIQRFPRNDPALRDYHDCPSPQVLPYNDCEATDWEGQGRLLVTKGFTRPQSNTGEKWWHAELTRRDGIQIRFDQVNAAESKSSAGVTRATPPLSPAQMTAIVTNPRWVEAAATLPAPERPSPGTGPKEFPGDRILAGLRRLLPKGAEITHPDVSDGYVSLILKDSRGGTSVGLNVQDFRRPDGKAEKQPSCAQRLSDQPDEATCVEETLPDGTMIWIEEQPAEVVASGVINRIVEVMYPNGRRVVARAANGLSPKSGPQTRDTPALSLEQIKRIVTDPTWRR